IGSRGRATSKSAPGARSPIAILDHSHLMHAARLPPRAQGRSQYARRVVEARHNPTVTHTSPDFGTAFSPRAMAARANTEVSRFQRYVLCLQFIATHANKGPQL